MTRTEEMLMRPDEYRVMHDLENGYWWYRGLRALLRTLMKSYAPANARTGLILDVGCGTGANMNLLQHHGRAYGIDIAEQAINFCRQRGIPSDRTFVASATDLPFAPDTFDLIVSFDVICNIPNDVDALTQIARALKPGGYFIVQLPAYQWLWSMHDVAVGHQRRYSTRDTREKLARAGLSVERILHTNAILLPFVALERLWRRRSLERGNHVVSDLQMDLPHWVNALLAAIYRVEITSEAHIDFPFGLSVIAIAKKK